MIIRIAQPTGVIPRLSPRELPDNAAQVAVNCYFDAGGLRPWNSPGASVATVANNNGQTLYRFGQDVVGDAQYWFSYAGVRDIAVTGLPDDNWGDLVVALVVGDIEAAALRAHARQHLPSSAQPRRIGFLEALPRNAAGKLERPALRRLAAEIPV